MRRTQERQLGEPAPPGRSQDPRAGTRSCSTASPPGSWLQSGPVSSKYSTASSLPLSRKYWMPLSGSCHEQGCKWLWNQLRNWHFCLYSLTSAFTITSHFFLLFSLPTRLDSTDTKHTHSEFQPERELQTQVLWGTIIGTTGARYPLLK